MAPGVGTKVGVGVRDGVKDPVPSPQVHPSPRDRLVRLARQVWFLPTVLTLGAGLVRIWRPELWRDELRSWNASSRTFGELFHLLDKTDAGVALYYMLLKVWMSVLGESAVSMRLLSTVAMAGAAACVALIGQRLWNTKTGLFAGIIFAAIPAITRFAQEVRPYALTMLMAGVCTLLLLRAIEKPTWGRFVAYGASLTGLALMQIVALPILAAHGVGVLLWWKGDRVLAKRWAAAVGAGILLAAPIVLLSHSQYPHQVGGLPDATLMELTRLPPRLFVSWLVAGGVIGVGMLAWNTNIKSAAFAASWAVLPIGAIWVVSNLGESYWMARYMVFTLPGFALLAAAALATLKPRVSIVMLVVLALLGVADQRSVRQQSAHDQWTYPEPAYVHNPIMYSFAADIIRQEMQPGDAIVYSARSSFWLIDVGLAYHMRNDTMPNDIFVQTSRIDNADFWVVERTDYEAAIGDTKRIWILSIAPGDGADFFGQLEPDERQAIFNHFHTSKTWHPSGLGIVLMERTPGQ